MTQHAESIALFDRAILSRATRDAVLKLNPRTLMRNPVIFVTEIVALLTTVVGIEEIFHGKGAAFSISPSPKRWPKGAGGRGRKACAGRGRIRWRS
jgi:K+-transporting ATPase ATPase B chain